MAAAGAGGPHARSMSSTRGDRAGCGSGTARNDRLPRPPPPPPESAPARGRRVPSVCQVVHVSSVKCEDMCQVVHVWSVKCELWSVDVLSMKHRGAQANGAAELAVDTSHFTLHTSHSAPHTSPSTPHPPIASQSPLLHTPSHSPLLHTAHSLTLRTRGSRRTAACGRWRSA